MRFNHNHNISNYPPTKDIIHKAIQKLGKLSYYLSWITRSLIAYLILSIFVLVFILIFLRYVFSTSLLWGEQVTKWLMIWVVFLGVGIAIREKENVVVQLFTDFLPSRIRITILLLSKIILLSFILFVLVVFGIIQAINNPSFEWAVGIRYMWAMLIVPIGGILMIIHLLPQILIDIVSLISGEGMNNKKSSDSIE